MTRKKKARKDKGQDPGLTLHITRELVFAMDKTHPLEALIIRIMLCDGKGRAVLDDGDPFTDLPVPPPPKYRPPPPTKENPIRITRETADSIKETHPFEGTILEIMLLDGRAILIRS